MQQDPLLNTRARAMRYQPTPAEHRLWQALRHDQILVRFVRQHPVGPYIVDFAARRAKLAIEIDGDTHQARVAYDAARTTFLERQGYRVLRFGNADVMGNLDGVLAAIVDALASSRTPHPNPPPCGGREQGNGPHPGTLTMTHGLLPEGLRDRLPPYAEAASRLLHRVIVAIGRHGYDRVSPPLAEYEEELVGRLKSARRQDLLRFVDPVSQRTLALRPDITGQVGRIAATRMGHLPRPLRLAYGGAVLKLRATQLRPERELTQAGAELIGSDAVPAVIEILRVAIEALEAAGATGITIDLTLPDLVETLAADALPIAAARVAGVRDALDAKDAGALGPLGAGAYLPLIEAAGPLPRALDRLRALSRWAALDHRLDAVTAIAAAFDGRADFTLDPTERHGFEYQSWIGFSLFAAGLRGEVGRGGSYAIVHDAGTDEPAVGFSLYIDPLVDAGLGQEPRRSVFVPVGADPDAACGLRREGWTTIAALTADDAPPAGCTHRLVGDRAVAL